MIERALTRILGVLMRAGLLLLGLAFVFLLLIWLLLMLLVSLLSSLFTGRAPTVAVLWRNYRQMASRRWPAASRRAPRADDANASSASTPTHEVQDVRWRDLPDSRPPPDDTRRNPPE